MIEALRKRFEPAAIEAAAARRKEKVGVGKTTGADGGVKIVLEETEVRRRKAVEEDEDALPAIS